MHRWIAEDDHCQKWWQVYNKETTIETNDLMKKKVVIILVYGFVTFIFSLLHSTIIG